MEFIPKASGSGILMRQFASAPLTGVETVDISVDLQSVDSVGDMFTFALSDTGNTTAKRFTLFEQQGRLSVWLFRRSACDAAGERFL